MSRFFFSIGWLQRSNSTAPPIWSKEHYRLKRFSSKSRPSYSIKWKANNYRTVVTMPFHWNPCMLIDLMLLKDSQTKSDIGSGRKRINVTCLSALQSEKQSYFDTLFPALKLRFHIFFVKIRRGKAKPNGYWTNKYGIFNLKPAWFWSNTNQTIRNHPQ